MPTGTDHRIDSTWEGELRPTLIHVPPGEPPVRGWPLVLAFHGRNIDAEAMVRLSGMNDAADRHGFIVAYPNGRVDRTGGRFWWVDYTPDAVVTGSQEIPFVESLLAELQGAFGIDPTRVVAAGFSNGAILSYALARWRSELFPRVAGVAGLADFGPFTIERRLDMLHIHGTRDRFVPYEGGKTARKDVPIDFPPVPDMLARWLEATGCVQLSGQSSLIDPADPSMTIRDELYGPGRRGGHVRIVTIEGGGHTWPGRPPLVSYLGKWTKAILAADLIASLALLPTETR
jgi:polyhydroxybutyrate depolymerase